MAARAAAAPGPATLLDTCHTSLAPAPPPLSPPPTLRIIPMHTPIVPDLARLALRTARAALGSLGSRKAILCRRQRSNAPLRLLLPPRQVLLRGERRPRRTTASGDTAVHTATSASTARAASRSM
uniref:Uncharacterized protein n=1 Tax=Trametes gibbosa TaxID=160864 RepID=A0A6G6FQ17_9APHY|nr:hypothetical protein [Trametes gibbosa]